MKSIVLTSQQNYTWKSMQEIIPFLIDSWKESDLQETFIIDVDQEQIAKYLPKIIEAENLILACFTPKIFKVAAFIRAEINTTIRLITHLHNQATIACWPMRYWGGKSLFRKSDVFVSSSKRDAECLLKTYPEAQCVVVPFSYNKLPEPCSLEGPTTNFVFIGRISSQKNLHTLLLSFKHFTQQNPELNWNLNIFGKEDGLGSPNMGFQDEEYEECLKNLAIKLEISDRINFNGFKDREFIQSWLRNKPVVFVAPSLHSDENFGMAAFQCLLMGHLAVLSDWGGHADFGQYFKDQTILIPVYKTPNGPWLDPLELAQGLLESTTRKIKISNIPQVYSFQNIISQNKSILKLPRSDFSTLKASAEADMIYNKVEAQISDNPGKQDQKIFDSYSDPAAIPFLESYGMSHEINLNKKTQFKAPWVNIQNGCIFVNDPHRGTKQFELGKERSLVAEGYYY